MHRILPATLLLALGIVARAGAEEDARLLRFPAIHGDRIAFSYAGNLYTVPATGGTARKLTSHEGYEMFPRYSPDGKWLAFTGQYDGNTEVYLMPADGGVPRRLTFTATLGRDDVSDRMGPNNIVIGWKHDSKHIVFRSRMREHNDFIGQLYLVSIDGGLPEQLPLPRGGFCSYSPDDSKLAYNRVFREFRTWKRYRGGMADDIWIYDFAPKKTTNITNNPAQDIIPMWSGNKIYFLSDREPSARMNLYVYDLDIQQTRQLTHYTDFDIKFPSLGDRAIVFENGGYIYRFDLASEKADRVPIRLHEDEVGGRGGIIKVSKNITNYEIAPDGKRALFTARGELFTVPAKHGPTRNLTNTSGVHERDAVWSPDGKHIAYISDATGEDEIYILSQDGKGKPRQLTSGADTYKYAIVWSPDSKKIVWGDRKFRVQFVDVDSKAVTPVAQGTEWEIRSYAWSPDSKWIAYAQPQLRSMETIKLYSLDGRSTTAVTDQWYESSDPVFSSDGKYLFFISNRDYTSAFGRTEYNHIYEDMARPYLVTLAKDTESPFKPTSDEVASEPAKPEAAKDASKKEGQKDPGKKEEAAKPATKTKVDTDGIADRIVVLPVSAGNYRHLVSVDNTLYYQRQGSKEPKPTLFVYDFGQQKEAGLGQVDGFEVSTDHKKMLVLKDGNYSIIDLPKGPNPVAPTEHLDLGAMEMKLDRHKEWQQIFAECWRQMRDFFYDPAMHGIDWKAMRQRYEPLVVHVNHRADLTYVIGEMIAELNIGHAYVGGGDYPHAPRIPTGLLGARLERDPATGFYRITRILKGQNWDKSLRSPLTEVGVNAHQGDYIVAIDGQPTSSMTNIYEALLDKADKQVTLRLNAKPSDEGAHDVVVVPTADENPLYYFNWVQDNIRKVDEASHGKAGYIHIPDMLQPGLNEFAKYFYPQVRKKALIIDVRGNGGGNVSAQIIERLRRQLVMIDITRYSQPTTDPDSMINGPMVCLLNEFSASDGDLFPYRFKALKMGKLIGKRSWGGVVGIREPLPLVDGGTLMKPEFSRYDIQGKKWIIEGHGVDPDIVVDNDPAAEFAGVDQQLNKAIEVILDELKTKEQNLPPVPPYPKK